MLIYALGIHALGIYAPGICVWFFTFLTFLLILSKTIRHSADAQISSFVKIQERTAAKSQRHKEFLASEGSENAEIFRIVDNGVFKIILCL